MPQGPWVTMGFSVTEQEPRVNSRARSPLPEGSLLAAIDLGSNSFHLVVARLEHGELRPVEALAEKVQLGAGLRDQQLSAEAIARGLDCLARFAQLLSHVSADRLRVVGTQALRVAENRRDFTLPARRILGAPVEVIYGSEEARLVYLGVAHSLADDAQSRLVIDIGGGSTEVIIGQRFEPQRLESLAVGCVSWTDQFFPGGELSPARFRQARDMARLEVAPIRYAYHRRHWEDCVGSSGTLRAIERILIGEGWSERGITRKGLARLEKRLLKYRHVDELQLAGLSNARRPVIVAGVAIASALFEELDISHMETSRGALREGVIYDLLGRLQHEDVRERTVNALQLRYAVDTDMARLMADRAGYLFDAVAESWQLAESDRELLERAALTHEIGMAIAHKHYQRHSAYLLRHADLPGFSEDEQAQLALLAGTQRGKLDNGLWQGLAESDRERLLRLIALMRLALVFKYAEQVEKLPDFQCRAEGNSLTLAFPDHWLQRHPLTAHELEQQQVALARQGLRLTLQ